MTPFDIVNRSNAEYIDQLYYQYQGYGAFNDPTVQQRLNLTDAQRQQFTNYNNRWNQDMNEYRRQWGTDREGVLRRWREARQGMNNNINTVLTPTQQQTWGQMIGQPYEFQPNVYFQGSTGVQGAVQGTTGGTITTPR